MLGLLGVLAACGDDDEASSSSTSSQAAASQEAAAPTATPTPEGGSSDITAGVKATPTPTPAGEKPLYGGTINYIGCCSGSVPKAVDPWDLRGANYQYIFNNSPIQMVFPFDPSKGVEYEGGLAVEWTQRDDGSWLLKLREGVTWHDGEAFTAEDVVATLERMIDEETEISPRQGAMRQIYTAAEVVDDYTVIVHTGGTPNATAFAYLSAHHMAIVPAHLIKGDPTAEYAQDSAAPGGGTQKAGEAVRWHFMMPDETGTLSVGTGPFVMTYWDAEVELVGERNPNYFRYDEHGQRLPYADAWVRSNVPDGTRRMARFAAGTLDYTLGKGAGLHPDRAQELCANTKDPDCYILEFPHGYFNTILNSESTEMWQDPTIIAASRYAQDMDEIAKLAYGGRQGFMVMDRSRYPDSSITAAEQAELLPWSMADRREEFVQKAKDLIVAAGYPDGFELPHPYFSNGLCSGSFLDQYSRQVDALVEVGINATLECREGVIVADELKAGKFSVNAPGGSTFLIDPADGLIKFHLKDSSMIRGPWRYPSQDEVETQYRKAQKTVDTTARNEIYKDIERYISNPDWTVYPNMYTVVYLALHGCVRNFHPGGTWDSHQWSHTRTWLEADSKCRESHSPYLESKGLK